MGAGFPVVQYQNLLDHGCLLNLMALARRGLNHGEEFESGALPFIILVI
jgi:hypothetical protein